jgi:hypothetical protein
LDRGAPLAALGFPLLAVPPPTIDLLVTTDANPPLQITGVVRGNTDKSITEENLHILLVNIENNQVAIDVNYHLARLLANTDGTLLPLIIVIPGVTNTHLSIIVAIQAW